MIINIICGIADFISSFILIILLIGYWKLRKAEPEVIIEILPSLFHPLGIRVGVQKKKDKGKYLIIVEK